MASIDIEGPATRADVPRVLTDIPGVPGYFWGEHSTCVGPVRPRPGVKRALGVKVAGWLAGAEVAFRLLCDRGKYPGVVTDGGPSGHLFALMQAAIPWGRKPHVMVDCNWYEKDSRLGRWAWRRIKRVVARSTTRFAVWASHEVEDYARAFGIPREKLLYVPHYYSLHGYEYTIRDDYLFAGGNGDRDYRTLIEAIRPLEVPAWIATTSHEALRGIEVPPHVRVEGTTHAGFRQAMAASRLVVVAMRGGLLHSGGQQTCLNAMMMGKPTIAVGRRWAVDLIEDRVDGLIVDYGDVAGLRAAVSWVLEDPGRAREMGERARLKAEQFPSRKAMETLYHLLVP